MTNKPSYKTERLVDLFPKVFAADDTESLLHKVLDAIGSEFMHVDEDLKHLLKSHWVNYAESGALDGLGAVFGIKRRVTRSGQLETDEAFRARLRTIVPLFAGGGTRRAILGATRSALGLPFDASQLQLVPHFIGEQPADPDAVLQKIRDEVDNLITLEEFSPQGVRMQSTPADVINLDEGYELRLTVTIPSADVREIRPRITVTFDEGGTYAFSLTRIDNRGQSHGIRTRTPIRIEARQKLGFTVQGDRLVVTLDEVVYPENPFVALDGGVATMPTVPQGRSDWIFRNEGGRFDREAPYETRFDFDTFDPSSAFTVEMLWLRYQPLTFTVTVPYFIKEAVAQIVKKHGYDGDLFTYEGLPIHAIPDVVNSTRAAGVEAIVQFILNFYEDHVIEERLAGTIEGRFAEDADLTQDKLLIANANRVEESQDMADRFVFGAFFDMSNFDTQYAFAE
jgi:hypothetical protein